MYRGIFVPKLVTVLREGYDARKFRADVLAGLTVAIVALPLSMALAIASGVGPERGLYTSIIGGFLVSALGGSRYQIGGPAGAFIVLVLGCVMAIGVPGLILATFLSGILLVIAGLLRIGTYIRYIPYPVTVAFTSGIGVIIIASQLRDFFGLQLPGEEPGPFADKMVVLWQARATFTWQAAAIAVFTFAVIQGLRRWRPQWPGMLIGVTLASVIAGLLALPITTIATAFGDLPNLLPAPELPAFGREQLLAALPFAFSFTLLGAIESLLSAVVADAMSGARHRSNVELIGQGLANMGSALFGGFCVTGTIARTATNVRAGSAGPVSGMMHSLFLLLFLLVAAPLAGYIPLAALAGLLVVVAWGMIERHELATLVRSTRGDALIVLSTFLLVVFRDLISGIVAGFAIAGLVFIKRMSESAMIRDAGPEEADERQRDDLLIYRLHGPIFFGSASRVGAVLDRITNHPPAFVMDLSDVPMVDSSGAQSLALLAERVVNKNRAFWIAGARPDIRRVLLAHGLRAPLVQYAPDVAAIPDPEA